MPDLKNKQPAKNENRDKLIGILVVATGFAYLIMVFIFESRQSPMGDIQTYSLLPPSLLLGIGISLFSRQRLIIKCGIALIAAIVMMYLFAQYFSVMSQLS
ncbi:MAG: hypothetical protein JWN33_99 [Candidatus Saccharibacteria bacterium]|nr:hypothetical protein [Candidatus Saccharibacteria bacterium]